MIESPTLVLDAPPIPTQQPLRLQNSQTHEALAHYLKTSPVDWDLLAYIHEGLIQADPSVCSRNTLTYLTGFLGELHVRERIRQFSTAFQEAIAAPAFLGRTKGDLRAARKPEGSVLCTNKNGVTLREYDDLLEIEGIPTIVEVKTTVEKRNLKKSAKEPGLREKLRLLRGFYGPTRTFGYMIVVPQNAPEVFGEFTGLGGVVVRTSSPHEEFVSHAATIEQILLNSAI